MRTNHRYFALSVLGFFLVVAGCQGQNTLVAHKLVATPNQHSVPMYPDEQTYLKVSRMQQQGGVEGMAGDVRKNFTAKDIDDQTPVTIVSSDDNGAVVEIAQGPMKGQSGFVPRQNID
jgi:hypothetical protein